MQQYPNSAPSPMGSAQYPQSPVPGNGSPYPKPLRPDHRERAFDKKLKSGTSAACALLCMAFALFFCDAFFFRGFGLNITVLTVLFYCLLFAFYYRKKHRFSFTAVMLTIPQLALSASFGLFYNPALHFMVSVFLVLIGLIQINAMTDTHRSRAFSGPGFKQALYRSFGEPFAHLKAGFVSLGGLQRTKGHSKVFTKVVIGAVISLPLLLVLIALFVAADEFYAQKVAEFFSAININTFELTVDLIFGFVLWIFLSAFVITPKYLTAKRQNESTFGGKIDGIIMSTILILVNLVLLSFVIVQFRYLFGGKEYVQSLNLSYADYARSGFFELSWATFLICIVVVLCLALTKKREGKISVGVRICAAFMCLCNLVVVASGLWRMALYIDRFGLSIKRYMTFWLMGVMGVCLVVLLLKCIFSGLRAVRWISGVVIASVCVLALSNMDAQIARYNVDRYIREPETTTMDVSYFYELSYSALPEAKRLEESGKLTDDHDRAMLTNIIDGWEQDINEGHIPFAVDRYWLRG